MRKITVNNKNKTGRILGANLKTFLTKYLLKMCKLQYQGHGLDSIIF